MSVMQFPLVNWPDIEDQTKRTVDKQVGLHPLEFCAEKCQPAGGIISGEISPRWLLRNVRKNSEEISTLYF